MDKTLDHWRLLRHPPAHGDWNMAVDEALLERVIAGQSPPLLRLYAWQPACLSLGQAQPAADVDRERLTGAGWGLVRRPTGGRAILHSDELTYAVIAPVSEPRVRGTLLESYLKLSAALKSATGAARFDGDGARGCRRGPGRPQPQPGLLRGTLQLRDPVW